MNDKLKELQEREKTIKKRMGDLLVKIRKANGIESSFNVTRELDQSSATLRNIEKGLSFPTKKTLKELMSLYIMTIPEKEEILRLKNEMTKIRMIMKKNRKGEIRR